MERITVVRHKDLPRSPFRQLQFCHTPKKPSLRSIIFRNFAKPQRVACNMLNQTQMPKDKRQKRDLHALNEDGMVLCNSRDKEAAHRAEVEGIATEDWTAVTCRKCLLLIHKYNKALQEQKEHS